MFTSKKSSDHSSPESQFLRQRLIKSLKEDRVGEILWALAGNVSACPNIQACFYSRLYSYC